MIDATTRQRLCVSTDGGAGPYIMMPVAQLETVTTLLNANKVSYWVDEEAISLDGKPEVTVINLVHGSEPERIQNLLDNIGCEPSKAVRDVSAAAIGKARSSHP